MKGFTKNAALAVVSLAFSLVLALVILWAICALLGANGRPFYENGLGKRLFMQDDSAGYRNRPHVNEKLFAGICAKTNGEGFRSEHEISLRAPKGRLRIIAMGDSVTWGPGVNEEDTFIERLASRISASGRDVQAYNAAVVGYSSLQEYLFYQDRIARFAPDILLVNYCPNDWLPTEDPFKNLSAIYAGYFRFVLSGARLQKIEELANDVDSYLDGKIRAGQLEEKMKADPDYYFAARRCLLDFPMAGIARCARHYGTRVIFLLIPTQGDEKRSSTYQSVMKYLAENNIEYLDLFDDLKESVPGCGSLSPLNQTFAARAAQTLDAVLFRLGFARPFERLGQWKALRRTNAKCNYLDGLGHISRKGHEIVAQAVFAYLEQDGMALKKLEK